MINMINNIEKMGVFNAILLIVLFFLPIIMYFNYFIVNKENQKSKNNLFLIWLGILNIILAYKIYHSYVYKIPYLDNKLEIARINIVELNDKIDELVITDDTP